MILRDKNSIIEALKSGRKVVSIRFFTNPEKDERLSEIAAEAARRKVRSSVVGHYKDAKGKSMAESVVEAECEDFAYTPFSELVATAVERGNGAQVVALDHIQDPRNLGAILRSAAAAGACGVIIQHKRCCPVTAVAYETSSGGAEHVPVAIVSNLPTALKELKANGMWVFGADERAELSVHDADLSVPIVWALGTEGKGLARLVRENCDFLVKIPTGRNFCSLNVSVAAGVLLFEGVRRKGGG